MGVLLHLEDRTDLVAAPPKAVTAVEGCYFYHSMDVPGHGPVEGEWDLRGGEAAYLAGVPLWGKRVLELGTADGYLTFYMEKQGADVVSFDLDADQSWDVVPFARSLNGTGGTVQESDWVRAAETFRDRITGLNNAYWLCHRAFESKAKMVYGNVYAIPDEIGTVDVTTFGAILMHTKDPFGALAHAARLTRETIIVTEARGRLHVPAAVASLSRFLPRRVYKPAMRFLPDWKGSHNADGWWRLSPEILREFMGVLGFERTQVTHHSQLYRGRPRRCFTVVGHRTVT